MPLSGVDPTPRPTAVYASNDALPRRPQDSLPSCLLGFGRTRLALASSHQLLLSHPALRRSAADMSDKVSAIPSTTPFAPSSLEWRRIIDFAKASAEAVGIEGVG